MRRLIWGMVTVPFIILFLLNVNGFNLKEILPSDETATKNLSNPIKGDIYSSIVGMVQPEETMEAIFRKHKLKKTELGLIVKSSKHIYDLSRLKVGNLYSFELDSHNSIRKMQYAIDDGSLFLVQKRDGKFVAKRVEMNYTKRIGSLYIVVKDNLISSMPTSHKEYLKLALKLSDIYAWDIDFSNDIMGNDRVKIVLEELWLGNAFKGFGNILAAEFYNNGRLYKAYRFEHDGHVDYYDANGKSLRKTLLRSPLKFKYVSSYFSKRRYHPILRVYRPHLGVDYAAPTGTPISAAGDGIVLFVGYNGQYGKMVRIKHKGGFETYYGHLSRIPKRIKRGAKVLQGEVIGYVGSTGLASGPHLDYRIKLNGRFVNPLKVKLPREKSISEKWIDDFKKFTSQMDIRLASLSGPVMALSSEEGKPLDDKI